MIQRHEYKTREEWLELRTSMEDRLGGSDIGVAAGHSPYRSPFNLFCEKVGIIDPQDLSEKEAVKQGHDLEQYVADRFTELTGWKVHEELCIFTNDKAPHLKASIDRKFDDGESGLECKTVKDRVMGKYAHGDFPQGYYDQCCCYLKVTELKRWYLAMLVFGTDFKVFCLSTVKEEHDEYERLKALVDSKEAMTIDDLNLWEKKYKFLEAHYFISQEELDGVETVAANFMSRVRDFNSGNVDAWPNDEIDGSESTTDALEKMNKEMKVGSTVAFDELNPNGVSENGSPVLNVDRDLVLSITKRRVEVDDEIKRLKTEKDMLDNQLSVVMGKVETFYVPGYKVTYKVASPKTTVSVDAIESYFAAKGESVPAGMVKVSSPERSIRYWSNKGKKKGKGK